MNIDKIFPDENAVKAQNDILDSLEASLGSLNTNTDKDATKTTQTEQIFDLQLDLIDDSDAEFKRILKWFNDSRKRMHHYDHVKVLEMYKVEINSNKTQFNTDKLDNIQEVWHGTSASNLLSIFKQGLKVSPPNTAAIAGKLYGNGTYGSKTSSKSMGYTFGRWGQSANDYGFLFVCDFAMGKAYYPNSYGIKSIPSGHDSCWALPEKTGLHNDELIVYKNEQVNLKYLLKLK